MANREKVVKALHVCFENHRCDGCPYEDGCKAAFSDLHEKAHCPMLDDALVLLEENRMNEWRDAVKDPPAAGKLNRAVLVVREIGKGREGYRKIDFGIYNEAPDCPEGGRWNKWGVIYWMPLPEIPEEGADG